MARFVRTMHNPIPSTLPVVQEDKTSAGSMTSIGSTVASGARGAMRTVPMDNTSPTSGAFHTKVLGRGHDKAKLIEDTPPILPGTTNYNQLIKQRWNV
jgi:hypothetical protein